jgi:LysR family transcriptional regulator (chromosome initiation inhibitor)
MIWLIRYYLKLQADRYLASGELVELMPKKHLNIPLYWHSWALEKGVQKALTDHIDAWGEKYFR